MKIFSCGQIKEIDSYTIKHEPIASIDLMERASGKLFNWITERYGISEHFVVFAGPGNNGGDGLALARMLYNMGYSVEIHIVDAGGRLSADCELNLHRLQNVTNVTINYLTGSDKFPLISPGDIIIDAIIGTGLTRMAEGLISELIGLINNADAIKISIDIPSGLFGEDNSNNQYDSVVRADLTLTFQFPKLAFLFPENSEYVGKWYILPIGLDENAVRNTLTPYILLENRDISPLLKIRNKFDHKGTNGHGLVVAGSSGKIGAAVLSAKAALRTGIGLITCHIPACGYQVLQTSVPEAIVITDISENNISLAVNTESYDAVGVGPGLGTSRESKEAIRILLSECKKPMILDADALNILSLYPSLLDLLPPDIILTPHPGEFERLAGKTRNGYDRLQRQIEFSRAHNCIILLKGAHSTVTNPLGEIFFNSTGNPGMATAGSGDVLTGIILSLLAQGYSPENAAKTGMYLHGLAGDIAARESCYESIIASDIINCIGKAFNDIRLIGTTT